MLIKQVAIITPLGAKTYNVGDSVNGKEIVNIFKQPLYFQGDPFDHYCGFDIKGEMVFSVNCLVPCQIDYL